MPALVSRLGGRRAWAVLIPRDGTARAPRSNSAMPRPPHVEPEGDDALAVIVGRRRPAAARVACRAQRLRSQKLFSSMIA